MKRIKYLFMFGVLVIAMLGIGAQKAAVVRAPNIGSTLDTPLIELQKTLPPSVWSENTLAAETDTFGLDSLEVANANIESSEEFSELYIEN